MTTAYGIVLLGGALAAAGVTWLLIANARALARHRVSLVPGRASRLSRVAWGLSLLSLWTGPLVLPLAATALLIGLFEHRRVLRGESPAPSELPARMAIENALVLLVAASALMLSLWMAWRMGLN